MPVAMEMRRAYPGYKAQYGIRTWDEGILLLQGPCLALGPERLLQPGLQGGHGGLGCHPTCTQYFSAWSLCLPWSTAPCAPGPSFPQGAPATEFPLPFLPSLLTTLALEHQEPWSKPHAASPPCIPSSSKLLAL